MFQKLLLLSVSMAMIVTLFGGEVKLSGDTYFTYALEDADNNQFQVNRAYFTFEKQVTEAFAYKFQTDVGSGGATDYSVYLKNAMVTWKTDLGKFSLGLQGMNMFKVQEGNWGYRFIEKSAMDKARFASSADMGVGWSASFGALTPSLMITNGTGYKNAEDDGYKKLSANLLYGDAKLKKGLNAGASFSYEPKDYDLVNGSTTRTKTGSATVLALYGAWAQGPLKLGAEFASQTKDLGSSVFSSLMSAYGDFKLQDHLSGFGRFDLFLEDGSSDSYAVFGVNYLVEKGLNIAPNIQVNMPDGGDTALTYRVNFRFKI